MRPDIKNRLRKCQTLPSPPGIVVSLLKLADDPEVTAQQLAALIENDPALTTRVLSIVNSPVFGLRREVTSLQQAVAFLGISGVRTVSLGFSLAKGLLRSAWRDIRAERSWKRAVTAAAVARDLAVLLHLVQKEEAFLGALLQDIGILALREVLKDEYEAILSATGTEHSALVAAEQEQIGCDHAEVGAWLLGHWGLPDLFQRLVRRSHDSSIDLTEPEGCPLTHCVALSGSLADIWLMPTKPKNGALAVAEACKILAVDQEELEAALSKTARALPELMRLFEVDLGAEDFEGMLDRARRAACSLSLQSMVAVREKEAAVVSLSAEVLRLRRDSERDPLTSAYNRLFMEEVLEDNFRQVLQSELALSLCFCDLDCFKLANDRLGHLAGDGILKQTADIISGQLRKGDFVSRYGGDEFVVLLLGCRDSQTAAVCERIRNAISTELTRSLAYADLPMTVSIGYAVQDGPDPFRSARELIHAADQALLEAKRQGRNCVIAYSSGEETQWGAGGCA
ncbi:MAG: GGDEF domain-containing protein [Acidobacteriota bacterium]